MNEEKEIIKKIISILPESKLHLNNFFESDSEILNYGDKKMLFTVDEFSGEDMFRDDDPYILGWNLAVGTISDILANGGKPLFYAHSIVIDEKWNNNYIESFTKGVADILKKTGAAFIGGDLGKSKNWSYTGIVIGETINALTRKGAIPGDLIYMTGKTGAGNLEAALNLYSNKKVIGSFTKKYKTYLNLTVKESEFIKDFASSCIDTSDGVLSALNTISEINNTGYEIRNLKYITTGVLACKLLFKPKTFLFMGECGEYELLFTVRKEDEERFIEKSKHNNLSFHKIGKLTEPSRKLLFENNQVLDLVNYDIWARNYSDIGEYLNDLTGYLEKGWKKIVKS
jgi:thiamine-monophosphate kinase